ncbi:solanesyl-diphosphate synthase 1, mitochondrial-like [Papaver somniferum]|uniref:solanesyl-diphosphate synthase 1, mitochondrial-like n=1 Tax=Papaver somniferum TaxID=3469 RepID=UPI000E7000C0|nr:solanesyl-diphosphate synthase 1, mitochondrial-like [Papaver somniferum]
MYSVVADDLLDVSSRLRSIVAAEVPKLASAAEYFFNIGTEGKKFRPTIMLLMASALNMSTLALDGVVDSSYNELHSRQLSIAVITEMIHVTSLLHNDVLDDAETRHGIGSLKCFMGNKMAVLAGDVLLSRALVALSSLGNNEVVDLIWRSVQHLVTGETMQMTAAFEQRCSMEYYMKMTYNKTAALISNSCQAVSIITGQTAAVSMLAYDYGWNMENRCPIQGLSQKSDYGEAMSC